LDKVAALGHGHDGGGEQHLRMIALALRHRLGEVMDGVAQVTSFLPSGSTMGAAQSAFAIRGRRGGSSAVAILQGGQGAPAPPQAQACGPPMAGQDGFRRPNRSPHSADISRRSLVILMLTS